MIKVNDDKEAVKMDSMSSNISGIIRLLVMDYYLFLLHAIETGYAEFRNKP